MEERIAEQIANELRDNVAQLEAMGRSDLLLQAIGVPTLERLKMEAARGRLSRLRITADYRFLLVDMDNQEVVLQPVHKAVYLLFLAHPEGIEFKRLAEYREELTTYYMRVARLMDKQKIEESIEHLVNPLDNAINEKCSRIKKVFGAMMDVYTSSYYIITGHVEKHINGSNHIWYERLKLITLPRNLVIIEGHRWDGADARCRLI